LNQSLFVLKKASSSTAAMLWTTEGFSAITNCFEIKRGVKWYGKGWLL
jgi:hypothetical protein